MADVNVANRNRNLANLFVDITTPIQGLTITPTAGLRWDDYPTDPNLLAAANTSRRRDRDDPPNISWASGRDHNWTAGIEANYATSSNRDAHGILHV